MTRTEAIKLVEHASGWFPEGTTQEALTMAIEALRKEEGLQGEVERWRTSFLDWEAERVEYIKTINKWANRWQELREYLIGKKDGLGLFSAYVLDKMDSLIAEPETDGWLREMGGF